MVITKYTFQQKIIIISIFHLKTKNANNLYGKRFFQLSSGNPNELFPTSSSKFLEPTVAKYSETSFLLGRDQTSVLVEEAKNIDIKKTIKWSEAPIAVGKEQLKYYISLRKPYKRLIYNCINLPLCKCQLSMVIMV